MARLETEINQIYLTHPESKKSSLILYEEAISNSGHLFVVAELKDLQKKSEVADLKKITEIILESFRLNKRLAAETLFESALSQINQNLADLAHEGHKSWVGKFSCLIALKSGENIYLANNGQTSAWLARKAELLEILKPEKRGMHPLKTFVQFTQGRIIPSDLVVITTSNIFNFVSVELFGTILETNTASQATEKISKILKESMNPEDGFSAFLLSFAKRTEERASAPIVTEAVYAPMPEEIHEELKERWTLPSVPALPKLSLPRVKLPKIKWEFFQNLSTAGKFFFISFSVFLLLFIGNLGVYGIKLHGKKAQQKITDQVSLVAKEMADAQSAAIYKSNDEALKLLNQAEADYETLKKMDATRAAEFSDELQKLIDQINKVSTINEPRVLVELKHHPTFVTRTSIGLLFANQDSNSLSVYDSSLKDYFVLNSLKTSITGITNYAPSGVTVSAGNSIYHIDTKLNQFEPIVNLGDANLLQTKVGGNNLYTLDRNKSQLIKISFTKNKYTTSAIATSDLNNIRDFGMDKDAYLLYPDKIIKLIGGIQQTFNYPTLTDPITNATKIFVGSNLYILEANKKRVVVLNKNGQLQNQIYFPSASTLLDLTVDEASRSLYLLDDNKLYKITF